AGVFSETQDYTGRPSIRLELFSCSASLGRRVMVNHKEVPDGCHLTWKNVYWEVRETTTAPPTILLGAGKRRRLLKNNSALLFWQHGIFHRLADSELQGSF